MDIGVDIGSHEAFCVEERGERVVRIRHIIGRVVAFDVAVIEMKQIKK